MRKGLLFIVSCLVIGLIFTPSAWSKTKTIKIGINAPMTGDIPKVGEGTKFAAQMWLEDIKAAGGLEVGGKKYPVELVIEDNESKAESAVKVHYKDDYRGRSSFHCRTSVFQAGDTCRRSGQQLQNPHDQPMVNQPRHHQGPTLCFSRLLSGSVPGAGTGQFHQGRIRVHQSCGALRRGQRLSQRGWQSSLKKPGKS